VLTQAELHEVLSYDPETGEFHWLVKPSARVAEGSLAGNIGVKGYRYIGYKRKSYQAHRLAWLYVYGKFPAGDLDFKNCDTLDIRIENLREATKSQNAANSGARANKLKGAYWHEPDRKWTAGIQRNGKHIWLGNFDTEEEAHAAYCEAARKLDGEFFHE
jgi:hypothetical protein